MHDIATGFVRDAAGETLGGRFVLRELLGRGGSARVWRASDTRSGEDVAIKVFFALDETADTADRRQAEHDLLAGLEHPNLVAVRDQGVDANGVITYLVMDLVRGTTMRARLRHGPMTSAEVCRLGAGLADALRHVHANGIVHRDVKPSNVMLADDDAVDASPERPTFQVKLTDFGVARLLDSTRMTAHGMTVGTANYLSPEQVRGAAPTPATDVYSLGLVLLEGLTGELAYPGHGVEAAVARLHRAPEVPSWLGCEWALLLGAMTAAEPALRPSLDEVAARLQLLADGDPTASLATELFDESEPISTPMRAARPVRGLVALAGLAAAAVVAMFALSWHDGRAGRADAAPRISAGSSAVAAPSRSAPHLAAPRTSSAPARVHPAQAAELAANPGDLMPTPTHTVAHTSTAAHKKPAPPKRKTHRKHRPHH